jgi:hypothetical protein
VDEQGWAACDDPQAMLQWLQDSGLLTDRKARLFGVTCCRRVWHMLRDERSRRAVELAERAAEGQCGEAEVMAALVNALDAVPGRAGRSTRVQTPAGGPWALACSTVRRAASRSSLAQVTVSPVRAGFQGGREPAAWQLGAFPGSPHGSEAGRAPLVPRQPQATSA